MPIKILEPSGLAFTDAHGVFRLIRGVSLLDRVEFQRINSDLIERHSRAIDNGSWDQLWEDQGFKSQIVQLLAMAHLKLDWFIAGEVNLIPQLLLTYPRGIQECLGDWPAWEYQRGQAGSTEVETAELQDFSSLLIEDINGALIEIFPLSAEGFFRFRDLIDGMIGLMDGSFHQAYDASRAFQLLCHNALDLFGLNPGQVSAALACELFFSDWIEEDGARQYMPGWLHQLSIPPKASKGPHSPLPTSEHPYHALIASIWGDAGLGEAIAAVNAIPYPVLISILRSRERMMKEARPGKKNSGKLAANEQDFVNSVDYKALEKEFMETWFIPSEIPSGATGSSQLIQKGGISPTSF